MTTPSTTPSQSTSRVPAIKMPAVPLPAIDQLSTGVGLILAAILVAAPALVGPASAFTVDGVALGGVELRWLLLALAAGFVVIALIDILGRQELRSGATILGFGAAVGLGLLLTLTVRDALGDDGDGLAATQAAGILVALWGAALATGSLIMGPTRTGVLIGITTIAISLLLPVRVPGEAEPVRALSLLAKGDGLFLAGLLAVVLVAGVARLLDLPRPVLIVLGLLALLATIGFPYVAPTDAPLGTAAAAAGSIAAADVASLVFAGCAWISLSTIFGRPSPEF